MGLSLQRMLIEGFVAGGLNQGVRDIRKGVDPEYPCLIYDLYIHYVVNIYG